MITHYYNMITQLKIFVSKSKKAAWEIGINGILSHTAIDYYTTNRDFSSDVLTRAQFFAKNGY